MIEPSYRADDIVVYDDVLPVDACSLLFRHLNGLDYVPVHRAGWRKVWRLHDGEPLRGRTAWYHPGTDPAGYTMAEILLCHAPGVSKIDTARAGPVAEPGRASPIRSQPSETFDY